MKIIYYKQNYFWQIKFRNLLIALIQEDKYYQRLLIQTKKINSISPQIKLSNQMKIIKKLRKK